MLIKEPCFQTKCTQCNTESAQRLLHHLPHNGTFLRLCTNCVLRIHAQSFCHTCFQIYPPRTPRFCHVCVNSKTHVTTKQKPLHEVEEFKFKIMDKDSAKKLLTSAKIASQLMNEAVLKARAEAEKRAKEAADSRKKAKEALEYLAVFVAKEKFEKKESYGNESVSNGLNMVVENDEDLMELTAEIVELMMDVDDNERMMINDMLLQ